MDSDGLNPTKKDKIPARVWNRVVRATNAFERDSGIGGAPGSVRQEFSSLMIGRGYDLPSTQIPSLSIVQFDNDRSSIFNYQNPVPENKAAEYALRPTLRGIRPHSADAPFAVLQEPILARTYSTARGVLSGICVAMVDIRSNSHTAAMVKIGDITMLESTNPRAFAATIVWRPHNLTGPQLCVLLLGSGGGSGGIRMAKTWRRWEKDTTQSLELYTEGGPISEQPGGGDPVTAYNKFATIPSGKFVALAWNADYGAYYVISAEC